MKISIKTTSYILIATGFYTLIVIWAVIFNFNNHQPGGYFTFFRETLFMIPVIYLLAVLRHFHENRSILITYTIFIIYDIALAVVSPAILPLANRALIFSLITISLIILLIILIVFFFKIRNDYVKYAYCLFGFAYLAYIILNVAGSIFLAMGYKIISRAGLLTVFFIPLSLFYALVRISKYIAQQDKLNQSILDLNNNRAAN